MRFIRITTNYPSYLKQFYSKHTELENQPYATQEKLLLRDCFGWADFWTNALTKLGYEVWEPIANAEPMQKAWAAEHGINFSETNWLNDIITSQIQFFAPDILLIDDYLTFTSSLINYIRQECPSIKLILGWCGGAYTDSSIFNSYDIILSNIPELVQKFINQGHRAEYIKHAFEPHILEKINIKTKKTIDFSFIGSIFKGKNEHFNREILIKQLLDRTPLQIWSDCSSDSLLKIRLLPLYQATYTAIKMLATIPKIEPILLKIPKVRNYVHLKARPSLSDYVDPMIRSAAHPPLFGLSMFQKLHDSKITLNNHINISSKSSSNMRMYEATGVGTCLLTDWKENLCDIFEPDTEIVTYRSVEECIDKVNWLLDRPKEMEKIARAGQVRTLKDHTFAQRALQLDELIKTNLKKLSS